MPHPYFPPPSPGLLAIPRTESPGSSTPTKHHIFTSLSPFTTPQVHPPLSPRTIQRLSASPGGHKSLSPRQKRVSFLPLECGTDDTTGPRSPRNMSPRIMGRGDDARSRSPTTSILRSPTGLHGQERPPSHFFQPHGAESSSSSSTAGPYASLPLSPGHKAVPRRTSRFDPMGGDEEDQDAGAYDELGHRHPLRRVKEEGGGDHDRGVNVSLPGIRSLFTVADQPTPSSSRPSLFQTPSLPSLVPGSPSTSPSTARTSRYNSHGSSFSGMSEPMQSPAWWAMDFDRAAAMPPMPHPPPSARSTAPYPVRPHLVEEPDSKRRRSDQLPSMRDPDEAARIRWQAQSRNASFPARQNSLPGTSTQPTAMLPPMSTRGSVSMQAGAELIQSGSSDNSRRPSNIPRSASIVGGQLSKSFADLSAADRASPSSPRPVLPSPLSDRKPSLFPSLDSPGDRRPSLLTHPRDSMDNSALPAPTAARSHSATGIRGTPSSGSVPAGDSATLRRHCLTRPPSPDPSNRPALRRSSLTESIMLRMGDVDQRGPQISRQPRGSIDMDKPSLSEPGLGYPVDRRQSADSVRSVRSVHLDSDGEGYGMHAAMRGRKRSSDGRFGMPIDEDIEMDGQPMRGRTGMDMLAESARHAQAVEDERRHLQHGDDASLDREDSPGRAGVMGQAGPKYTCSFCSKQFSRPSSLRIHTYSHTGERPFVCKEPTCRRRFSVQSNLKRHAKVHQMGGAGSGGGGGPVHPHHASHGAHGHSRIVHPHPGPRHHPMGGPLSAPLPLQHPSSYPGGGGPRHMHPPPMTGYFPGHPGQPGGYFDRAPPHGGHGYDGGPVGSSGGGRGLPARHAGYRGGEDWEEEEEEPEEDELDEED